jgi:putative transposase
MPGHRKSYRLKNYDYSKPGYYFVTILTKNRVPYFGVQKGTSVLLSECGEIAKSNLLLLPSSFPHISLDEYIIMPDHIHGILLIWNKFPVGDAVGDAAVGDAYMRPLRESNQTNNQNHYQPNRINMVLSKTIQQYKASVSRHIHKLGLASFQWQRSFYDRIVRDDKSLYYIRRYIIENPWRHSMKKVA